jgi:hypothetical protein
LKSRGGIGSCHLSCNSRTVSRGGSVTDVDDDKHKRSYYSDEGPGEVPGEEPWFVNRLRQEFFNWGKRKCDNLPAMGANGEVSEGLLALESRQCVFDEGVELVRVWMMPGLEEFAHS